MKITVFYSPTCIPCKLLNTRIEEILKDHPEIEYNHLNALEHPEYNIKGTPHVIIEKDGNILFEGHGNVVDILKLIKENL